MHRQAGGGRQEEDSETERACKSTWRKIVRPLFLLLLLPHFFMLHKKRRTKQNEMARDKNELCIKQETETHQRNGSQRVVTFT